MTMNPLPPQAYTKETMLKAYQWLMVQNASIKEMATTPDILVSLYLKATRDGDHSLDRPSIQNFKNELRSLAGMMGELDRPALASQNATSQASSVATPSLVVPPPQPPTAPPMPQPQAPVAATAYAPQVAVPSFPAPPQHLAAMPSIPQSVLPPQTYLARSPDLLETLDGRSKMMIQEVKDEFNLSSDLETLRMLIKLGYNRSKSLLK